ncbi:MAG: O-antigen ligase family protein [Desulfuromonadales bacterium]|nr:O-antigen ligase family protein [Desulfuromonadales bacterium]
MLPAAEQIQIILPVACVVLLVMSFKRSVFGVVAYFVILNAKLGDMYPVLGAIRFELVAALVVLASIPVAGGRFSDALSGKNRLNKSLWLLFFVGMVSVVQSVSPSVSWDLGGYNLLKMTCFYVMVVASVREEKDLRILLWGVGLVTCWIAYEPVTNYFRGVVNEQGYGDVAVGRFGVATGHVALANTLVQMLPLVVLWGMAQKGHWSQKLIYAMAVFLVIGVILTKSRGGFVGLASVGFGLAWISKNRAKGFLLAGIFLGVCLMASGDDFTSRIATIGDGVFANRSTSDRYLGLVNGISMMIKRPLLGVGIGAYPEARSQFFNYWFYSHNLYGELLGELGLASVVWFYWIFAVFRRSSQLKAIDELKNQRSFYWWILSAVQIGLFVRLVIGNFSHCAFIWYWFLMAGLVVGIENILNNSNVNGDVLESFKKGVR